MVQMLFEVLSVITADYKKREREKEREEGEGSGRCEGGARRGRGQWKSFIAVKVKGRRLHKTILNHALK